MKFRHFWPHLEISLWLPLEKSPIDPPENNPSGTHVDGVVGRNELPAERCLAYL